MIRICCSEDHEGDRVIGEKEPFEDKSLTHGLCEECLRKALQKLERKVKK